MVRYTIKAEDGWLRRVDVAADNLRYMREQIDPANGGIGLDGWPRWNAGRTVSPDWVALTPSLPNAR